MSVNIIQFDANHKGLYVGFSSDRTKARRQVGFCDGVVVSECFVRPGELVAVEIMETQRGWSGDIRVGFTLLPDQLLFPLPSFALPQLVSRGQSWVVPVGTAVSLLLSHRHQSYWKRQQQRKSNRHSSKNTFEDAPSWDSFNTFSTSNSHSQAEPLVVVPDNIVASNLDNTLTSCRSSENASVVSNECQSSATTFNSSCLCCLHTKFGRVAFSQLIPSDFEYLRPPGTEKGSVIAIYYDLEPSLSNWSFSPNSLFDRMNDSSTLTTGAASHDSFTTNISTEQNSDLLADPNEDANSSNTLLFNFRFHIVINGIDLVAISEPITVLPEDFEKDAHHPLSMQSGHSKFCSPYGFTPRMRAVFDVYGQTKTIQLRSLNQSCVASLSRLCSCAILNRIFDICKSRLNTRTQLITDSYKDPAFTKRFKFHDLFINGQFKPNILNASNSSVTNTNAYDTTDGLCTDGCLKQLSDLINYLPLPAIERRHLQRDVFAILTRTVS